jgi:hypothetical protein
VVLFEHNEQMMAMSASHDASARVWELTSRPEAEEAAARQTHEDAVDLIACAENGLSATATTTWPRVHLWDAHGVCLHQLSIPLTAGDDGHADLLKGVGLALGGLALSADGSLLAVARTDGDVVFVARPRADPRPAGKVSLPGAGLLSFSQMDGLRLVSSAGDAVALLDPSTAEIKRRVPVGDTIVALAAQAHGGLVAVATATKIITVDMLSGQVKASMAREAAGEPVLAFALTMRDGKPWLLSYEEGTESVLLRDALNSGEEELALEGEGTSAAAIACDGQRVALGAEDGGLSVWDVAAGGELLNKPGAHAGPVDTVAWTADGAFLLTGGQDGAVKCWNARRHFQLAGGYVFESPINDLGISPDGKAVVVGLRTGEVGLLHLDAADAVPDVGKLAWGDNSLYKPAGGHKQSRPPERLRKQTVSAASGAAASAARVTKAKQKARDAAEAKRREEEQAQQASKANKSKKRGPPPMAEEGGVGAAYEEGSKDGAGGGCCVVM